MRKATKEEIRAHFVKYWGGDTRMVDYCTKQVDIAVILSNGVIVTIDKESIQKDYCFGFGYAGGYATEEEAEEARERVTKNIGYFVNENMEDARERLKNALRSRYLFLHRGETGNYTGSYYLSPINEPSRANSGEWVKIDNPEDLRAVKDMIKEHAKNREKQVMRYLKRYGLSKIKSWTYWADR